MSIWKDWTNRVWQRTARGVRTWMGNVGEYQEFRLAANQVEAWSSATGRWQPVARCQFRMQAAEAVRQLGVR